MPIVSEAQRRLVFRAEAGKSSKMSIATAKKFLRHGNPDRKLPERKRKRKTIATS